MVFWCGNYVIVIPPIHMQQQETINLRILLFFCNLNTYMISLITIISNNNLSRKAFETPHLLFSAASSSRFMTSLATRFSVSEVVIHLLADSRLKFPLATGVA